MCIRDRPHTYTRTKALFDDFVRELQLPDITVLAALMWTMVLSVAGGENLFAGIFRGCLLYTSRCV